MYANPPLIVVNPRSGSGLGAKIFDELRELKHPSNPTVVDISKLPTLDLKQHPYAVVCGGDGTITSVVGKSVTTNSGTVIVPGPLGTANDLAREFHISRLRSAKDVMRLLEVAPKLKISALSVWEAAWGTQSDQKMLFTNYLSLGFDAQVVKEFAQWRASRVHKPASVLRNRIQYALSGIRNVLYKLPHLKLTSSEREFSVIGTSTLLFANIRSILGFGRTHPSCDPSDNRLDALRFPTSASYLRLIPVCNIVAPPERLSGSTSWKVSGDFSRTAMQIDGEAVTLGPSQEVRIHQVGTARIAGF